MVKLLLAGGAALLLLFPGAAAAQMAHNHAAKPDCADPGLKCASKVTPTFAPDGALWLAWAAAGKVSVARSLDLGRTFTPPVAVNPEPLELDWGPDARPKIAVDRDGRVFVAFTIFKDKAFNGQVLYTRSTDGGHSFAPPLRSTRTARCLRLGSTSAIASRPRRETKTTSARPLPLPGRTTGVPPFPTRASRKITPANAAGSALHSRDRAGRWSGLETYSAARCAITP
jgi:hypothetical protein